MNCVGLTPPTSYALKQAFETGEKAIVFVRRVATVDELASKLDRYFDIWIREKMETALPELRDNISRIFKQYEDNRRGIDQYDVVEETTDSESNEASEERSYMDIEDKGGKESFFSWFFRGDGPPNILSGASYQQNRLSSFSAVHSTMFEEDHTSWLLGRPANVIDELCKHLEKERSELKALLKNSAYGHFKVFTKQKKSYPKLYAFEAYQRAALELLRDCDGEIGKKAGIVLVEKYPEGSSYPETAPVGFHNPDSYLGISTFFTELIKENELRDQIWPDDKLDNFSDYFKRREQRRELISGMARLGASYIDLYLLAIHLRGSFSPGREKDERLTDVNLPKEFVKLLKSQMTTKGFHAFYELSNAAKTFDLILAVNFSEFYSAKLIELPTILGRTLQRQVPIGRMQGTVTQRLVRQFRMPGYPLIMVSTDVLQEGEDLHTFCKKVIHYGIAWTPSAIEQRIGRVDRIGGLIQRKFDGASSPPSPEECIQVYYPHLKDTVEVLQVRRVLKRLNIFMHLIHRQSGNADFLDNKINAAEEMLEEDEIPMITDQLQSAFPIKSQWLNGNLDSNDVVLTNVLSELGSYLNSNWQRLIEMNMIRDACKLDDPKIKEGFVCISENEIVPYPSESDENCHEHHFHLELRSQVSGDATLLRCTSEIGYLPLSSNDDVIDELYEMQLELGQIKICVMPETKKRIDYVSIEGDILFHPETTQFEELLFLIKRTAVAAFHISKYFQLKE